MLYLTNKYDKERKISFDENSADHWEMMSWLMFQMYVGQPGLCYATTRD